MFKKLINNLFIKMHREIIHEQFQFILDLFNIKTFNDMARLGMPESYLSTIEMRKRNIQEKLSNNLIPFPQKEWDKFLRNYLETTMASVYEYHTVSHTLVPDGAIYVTFKSDNKHLKPLYLTIAPNDLNALLKALNGNPRYVFDSIVPEIPKTPLNGFPQFNLKEKALLPIITNLKDPKLPESFITTRETVLYYAMRYYPMALVTEDLDLYKGDSPFVINKDLLQKYVDKKIEENNGGDELDPLLMKIFSCGVLEWAGDIKEPDVTRLTSNNLAKVTTVDGVVSIMLTQEGWDKCTNYYENLGRK